MALVQACKFSNHSSFVAPRIVLRVVSSAYCWSLIPKEPINRPTGKIYIVNSSG